MRHGRKIHKLSKAADQRKALLRSLASQLFLHGEITTTMARAKALKPFAESIITFAKKGDLAARREAKKDIYDIETEKYIDVTDPKDLLYEATNWDGATKGFYDFPYYLSYEDKKLSRVVVGQANLTDINVYDLINADTVVVEEAAVKYIEEVLK